ncbi:NAD-dependent epimerase/dehydratase family protein, partial [bacterium]|nr:NAD-dependent epimerase/dehydratase family protein [bacterium]
MFWILGGSGYIGEAIVRAARDAKQDHLSISRKDLDYGDFKVLLAALKKGKPDFVINAAGFTGKPNVDACEKFKAETIAGNVTLALSVAQACDVAGTKLGTVSSGCIYTGAKILRKDGSWAVEDRLTEPLISELLEQRSDKIRGFGEADEPNFTFEHNNCSFYSGTKAVAEQALRNFPDFYVWRIRIPFDE